MKDKDAQLMMEGLYKDISQKYGQGPVAAADTLRAEVEHYLRAQPEVQAGVLAILDKHSAAAAPPPPAPNDPEIKALTKPFI
jgi:hypothetical protein